MASAEGFPAVPWHAVRRRVRARCLFRVAFRVAFTARCGGPGFPRKVDLLDTPALSFDDH